MFHKPKKTLNTHTTTTVTVSCEGSTTIHFRDDEQTNISKNRSNILITTKSVLVVLVPLLILTGVIVILNKPYRILSRSEMKKFKTEILNEKPNEHINLDLLYKASRDGFDPSIFHEKCDHKGPTLIIIKSGEAIFGGFASKSWTKTKGHVEDKDAFLFSIKSFKGEERFVKLKQEFSMMENSKVALYHDESSGPVFGIGHDLFISGKDDSNNYSIVGKTYGLPFRSLESSIYLAGFENFKVDDYEVYSLMV